MGLKKRHKLYKRKDWKENKKQAIKKYRTKEDRREKEGKIVNKVKARDESCKKEEKRIRRSEIDEKKVNDEIKESKICCNIMKGGKMEG